MPTPSMLLPADPKASYLAYKEEIDAAIHRVLDSGWYILGQEVRAFEQEFADYLGASHALGVASGTDALQLALRTCDVGPGDSVVTVSHTAVATVAAIELAGAVPILVDIDPLDFTLDPNQLTDAIEHAITPAKAVIPVHLYGHPADMQAIMEIATHHGLYVIEDCAQSHGASRLGRKTGTWGHMSAFSFYPTKNLGALGDGGAVVTSDPGLAEKARLLREYGWEDRYVSSYAGMNSRLDELQAAILRAKLRHLSDESMRRREIAQHYNEALSATELTLPTVKPDVEHVFHQYVVRSPRRDDLRSYLREHGVGSLIHYPVPVHLQPAYEGRASTEGKLCHTEQACQEILSLPLHAQLTKDQVQRVSELVCQWSLSAPNEP